MAQNDFKAFAIGSGANVQDQAGWEGNATLVEGFFSGIAKSAEANKAIRQPSFVAAALSEWINQQLVTVPILDDGIPDHWINAFDAALRHRIGLTHVYPPGIIVYVATTGSDIYNDGLSPTTPFQTIQHAVNYLNSNVLLVDNATAQIIIAGPATYNESIAISGSIAGQKGQEAFIIGTSGGQVHIHGTGSAISIFGGAQVTLQGQFLLTCMATGFGPNYVIGGIGGGRLGIYGGGTVFGDAPHCVHIAVGTGCEVNNGFGGSYTIAGGGHAHYLVESAGRIIIQNAPITLAGGPLGFEVAFAQASDCGIIVSAGASFILGGVVTVAQKYLANLNGVINTAGGGPDFYPGHLPGTTGSGGQYA